MRVERIWRALGLGLIFALAGAVAAQGADPHDYALEGWLAELERAVPRDALAFSARSNERLAKAADATEQWAVLAGRVDDLKPAQTIAGVRRLLAAKSRVDRLLDATFEVRGQFAAHSADSRQRDALRAYLAPANRLIDLSGRLRYLQVDAIQAALPRVARQPSDLAVLLDVLIAERSTVGALARSQRLQPSRRRRAECPVRCGSESPRIGL